MTNQKTNWKFVAIVVVLVVIVGGGILWWIKTQEVPPTEFLEIEKPEKVIEKCKDIQDLVEQAKCYKDLTKETKDESYCEKIEIPEAPEVRANCYNELAILKNDSSICWKVETASLASSCWEYFGMKNWKIYGNEEYGYEVKYPQKWKAYEGIVGICKDHDVIKQSNLEVSLDIPSTCVGFNPPDKELEYEYYYHGVDILITVYQNSNNLDLRSFYTQPCSSEHYSLCAINPFEYAEEIGAIQVGDILATKFKGVSGAETFTRVSIPFQKKVIEIDDVYNLHQQDDIFNQMLSTFRFLE